jgi:putative ABC transport system ATP-binding protein
MAAPNAAATPEKAPAEEIPVRIEKVNYAFGDGETRKQVLSDISVEIRAGEIVILTGPSGSGKTTLLTLIGALRSAQDGGVKVLGKELRGASSRTLTHVRREIGYIFQLHNLLDCLTTTQNVQMALQLRSGLSRREMREKAVAMLESVGLGDYVDQPPRRLSGGQKQRVAIARALVREPRLILADEPTASLDKKSGRDVVELMQRLAKEHSVTVVLVTHDNRILDIADRIIHLEDGKLSSFSDAVLANTQQMMNLLIQQNRKGELARRVIGMPEVEFMELLGQVTVEAQKWLQAAEMAGNEAFESMLDQVLDAFTRKIGELLGADRASLFLLDEDRGELWSKVARDAEGDSFEIRIPRDRGIVGAVASSGQSVLVPDAYADARFDQSADRRSGYRTRSILSVPLLDQHKEVFGVAQMLNRLDGQPFDDHDERRFIEFMNSMSVILESWWRTSSRGGSS